MLTASPAEEWTIPEPYNFVLGEEPPSIKNVGDVALGVTVGVVLAFSILGFSLAIGQNAEET